jgi:hypothetical protein
MVGWAQFQHQGFGITENELQTVVQVRPERATYNEKFKFQAMSLLTKIQLTALP